MLMSRRTTVLLPAAVCVLAFAASPARAVIVDGANGTGTANVLPASAPPVAGSANAGTIGGASGVYLGNRWAMTVAHTIAGGVINPGSSFVLADGRSFTVDQTSTRLVNPADGQPTDILLIHLATDPVLPTLSVGSSTPNLNTLIYTMGNGLTRSTAVPGTGYSQTTPPVYRWGTNRTSAAPNVSTATTTFDRGAGTVTIFASTFDSGLPTASESQVSTGDSGGPVFTADNVLVGLNEAAFSSTGQPANTAYYGNLSGYIDLSVYRSQIVGTTGIPEPATVGLLGAAAVGLLARRRRA